MYETRVLRFAIYGPVSCGKSCYLASMASDAAPNPNGFVSDWLFGSDHCPTPTANSSPEDRARFEGKDWLNTAILALKQGNVPPPTSTRTNPYRFRFVFRGPEFRFTANGARKESVLRNYQAELIDFSGELLDPDINRDAAASILINRLREMDGIIVLVEAPRSIDDHTLIETQIKKMRAAFEGVVAERRSQGDVCPVAMVINKWDRINPDYVFEPEQAHRDALAFLGLAPSAGSSEAVVNTKNTNPPAHRRLYDSLIASVGESNFRVFLGSAFGKSRIVEVEFAPDQCEKQERPVLNGRKPYGLEDPFMWLAKRREEQLVKSLNQSIESVSPVKPWQLLNGQLQKAKQTAAKLGPFLDSGGQAKNLSIQTKSKLETFTKLQIGAVSVAALMMLLLVAEVLVACADYFAFHRHAPLVERRVTQIERAQLTAAETWLSSYCQPSYARSLSRILISRQEAQKSLEGIHAKQIAFGGREELEGLANAIAEASDEKRLTLLGKQLADFRSRAGHTDLTVEVSRAEQALIDRTNFLTQRGTSGKLLQTYRTLTSEQELDLIGTATLLLGEYRELGDRAKEVLGPLKEDFQQNFEALLRRQVAKSGEKAEWARAKDECERVLGDRSIAKLIQPEVLKKIRDNLVVFVSEQKEKQCYEAVLATGSRSACENYLQAMGAEASPSVLQHVRKQLDYLDKLQKEVTCEITVDKVYPGKWSGTMFSNYKGQLKLEVNSITVLSEPMSLKHDTEQTTNYKRKLAPCRLNEGPETDRDATLPVKLELEALSSNSFGGFKIGSVTRNCSLRELSQGIEFILDPTNKVVANPKVHLKLSGLPMKPALPRYSDAVGGSR